MSPTDIAGHQDAALARLLELGLAAAEKVQARLMASEDDAMLGHLSLALNRASRNVRQTIALQMRAARDRRLEVQEAHAEVRRGDEARRSELRTEVKAAIERRIWDERDAEEAEMLVELLDDHLNEYELSQTFDAETVEVHVARLCAELDLAAPAADPPAPDTSPPPVDADDDDWRSSA